MMSVYKTKLEQSCDKYYKIGYDSFIKNLPKNTADQLALTDRDSFIKGWDAAETDFLTKCPAAHRHRPKV